MGVFFSVSQDGMLLPSGAVRVLVKKKMTSFFLLLFNDCTIFEFNTILHFKEVLWF